MMDGAGSKRIKNLLSLLSRKEAPVGKTPADVVYAENKWRLLRYVRESGRPSFRTPVLLVPSLINRHYVLDLLPGKSFAQFMVDAGHDVYMLDWGRPSAEDKFLTFDDVCDGYLGRAIRAVSQASNGPVHLFGYCLGGTLTTIHAAAHPERVASLAQIAAPISFTDDGQLATWTRAPSFDVDAVVDAFGNVPSWLMQASFQMLRPTMNLSKLVHLLDKAGDDDFLEGFRAIETWANDNVDFPGEVYRRYITELYRENRLMKGTFRLAGRAATLESITCPVMCITFEHDTIVPAESANVILERVRSKDKVAVHLPGGHVGSVVSRAAKKHLWPQISSFWASRDGVPASTAAAKEERALATLDN